MLGSQSNVSVQDEDCDLQSGDESGPSRMSLCKMKTVICSLESNRHLGRNPGYPRVQGLNLAMNGQKAVKAPKETRRPKMHWDHVLEEMAWLSKAVEAPKEPQHPKTNWDHVLEEMAWLSMDIESERIWKLAQAKKVEIRANQATRGEKRVKLELDAKKKKALDKQLEFLLGQTERTLSHRVNGNWLK
ncbi:UNVERIFIED_CONTAM: protein PHOTOPERIOD-INDEPENDENT EARLY FLOWERING 1 [Sesamum calycinum]|uniref:Protein PHOTOPERIOD-INDEPENDENT EARLY FLOWERING 1 n=1 Tax=Sesamum calycinum TaxID=2727403 RepID=A0AAW2JTP7_9LAMI